MHCPSCHQSNPDDARFCLQCGAALATLPTDHSEPGRAALDGALGAQYEIVRILGRGGMGAVYLARERALERAVAIKVLPPDVAADHESRERFRREARTAAKLTHPNIVPLYSVGEADGMLYLVMGYVRGESLGERMRRDGALQPDDVRRILGQLADALDYAHRQGVVHRDIKPDNVLLDDESGRPMLTDFGVAKARASGSTLTEVGAVLGTPHYMSPEQASGERDLDGRSDLYSLGVMGYEMLSGRLPFEGESFRDVIVQHLAKAPPPLRTLVPDVPPDLDAVVARALSKDPDNRWANGRAFALAVGEAGDDDTDSEWSTLSITGSGFMAGVIWIGAGTLAIFARTTQFFLRPTHPGNSVPPWWLLPLLLGAVPTVAIGGMALVERLRGDRWSAIIARVMLAPRTWPCWWPRRWRRAGDVWDRLPVPLRRFRVWGGALLPFCYVAVVCSVISMDSFAHEIVPPRWLDRVGLGSLLLTCTLFLAIALKAEWWARRTGLTRGEQKKVLVASTSQMDLWRKAKFAALLKPAGVGSLRRGVAEPQAPRDYVRAIAERVADLPGPVRELGDDASTAAGQMLAAIEGLDAELAVLVHDASPAELAQLEQKLALLGDETGDSANRRALREMLTSQRDLMRRLAEQLADTVRRRDHMLDLLRTLWLQVATLRADAARDARADSDITGRIRTVVAEMGAYGEAAATLRLKS